MVKFRFRCKMGKITFLDSNVVPGSTIYVNNTSNSAKSGCASVRSKAVCATQCDMKEMHVICKCHLVICHAAPLHSKVSDEILSHY